MSEDKENENSNENHGSEILDLKNEIADIYIKKAIEKGSAGSFVIGEGKNIKDYLVSENAIDKFFDKIRGNLAANVLSPLDPELVNYFTQAKETLDNYTTKEELLRLKTELSSTENTDDSQTQTTDNSSQTTNPSETPSQSSTNTPQNGTVVPIYSSYEKFKVDNDITSEDINYVNENSKYIVEKLQTKGVLTKIKEIKNKNGEVILNCKGTNPYVNSQAVVDLIGLSLLFYRKSGESLVINSGYRTVAQQAAAAAKNPDRSKVAAAGYSAHNLGYAIDVADSRYNKKIGGILGFRKMAESFNFDPYSAEDWHFNYKKIKEFKNREEKPAIAMSINQSYDQNWAQAA